MSGSEVYNYQLKEAKELDEVANVISSWLQNIHMC